MTRRSSIYFVALALLVAAVSCGSGTARAVHHRAQSSEANGDTIDFSQLPQIADLSKVASVGAAANSGLAFAPDVPTALGVPETITVSQNVQTLALIYNDPQLGRYWVEETVSQTSNKELQAMADCAVPAPDCDTDWTSVTLGGGTPAIALPTPNIALIFLNGSMRFDVLGPAGTFTVQGAVKVANALNAAASTPALRFH